MITPHQSLLWIMNLFYWREISVNPAGNPSNLVLKKVKLSFKKQLIKKRFFDEMFSTKLVKFPCGFMDIFQEPKTQTFYSWKMKWNEYLLWKKITSLKWIHILLANKIKFSLNLGLKSNTTISFKMLSVLSVVPWIGKECQTKRCHGQFLFTTFI